MNHLSKDNEQKRSHHIGNYQIKELLYEGESSSIYKVINCYSNTSCAGKAILHNRYTKATAAYKQLVKQIGLLNKEFISDLVSGEYKDHIKTKANQYNQSRIKLKEREIFIKEKELMKIQSEI